MARSKPTVAPKPYEIACYAIKVEYDKNVMAKLLSNDKDADIIEWLERHKPKQRYIRDLIRRDMDNGGN